MPRLRLASRVSRGVSAIELGPFGITANAVAPGFVESQMTYATAARVGMDFEVFKQVSANLISVRRTGLPEDIAHAVSFFVDRSIRIRLRSGPLRVRRPASLNRYITPGR